MAAEPVPADTYGEAKNLAGELAALDGPEINPVCRSRVWDQGERTERAVVLLHGYTNCPAQFDAIADAYAQAGYSVVVPRLPGHGQADRLTTALSDVTPARLVDVASRSVDIAAGLGDEVTVVGLSGGGTLAGYLAGHRDDVDRAVLMAPLIVPKALPAWAVGPTSRAFRYLPDIYWWWDGEQKAQLDDPPYAYPRFSFRSMGAFLAVGRAAQAEQPRRSAMTELVVITNENDGAVSNVGVRALAEELEPKAQERTDQVFPASDGFGHD
ncbi:MAG: alpha/beta fold hydrolase, partial [Ornithinimicrobium sp.]